MAGFAPDRESRTNEFKAASLTKPVNDLALPTSIDVPPKGTPARHVRKGLTPAFQTTYTHLLPDPSDPLPDPHIGYLVSNICNKTCIPHFSAQKTFKPHLTTKYPLATKYPALRLCLKSASCPKIK